MSQATVNTFTDDALGDHDAVGTAERVRSGEVSATEVAQAAVTRSKSVDESLNAVQEQRYDAALAEATRPVDGPFIGVPMFIKNMLSVAGMHTRYGSQAFEGAKPRTTTDPFVTQMLDMGLVNLGMSTMPEFGFTPSTEFPDGTATHNPWNTEHTAGGSSGGSGALVAAGVVPISHTADGGGSTRIPAGCNGLVGLKPSRGRLLPSENTERALISIVTDGVVTRSVRDHVAYYSAAEAAHANPKLKPIGIIDGPLERPLRIAASTTTQGAGHVDEATQREFDKSLALLESLGHSVEQVEFDIYDRFGLDFVRHWAFGAFAYKHLGKKLMDPAFDKSEVSDLTNSLARRFRREALHLPGAVRRLRALSTKFTKALDSFDVLVTPTTGQLSPKLGYLSMQQRGDLTFSRIEAWACFTPVGNASGAPSISLPLGHDDATNLPVGMCFSAHHGEDRLLLELALQLEQAQPFRKIAG